MNPLIEVGLIAFVLSLFSVLVTKLVVDEDRLNETRKRMSEDQKRIRKMSPDSKEYKEVQDRIVKDSLFVTKESYKPMLYTTVVFILVWIWLAHTYAYAPIAVNNTIFLTVYGNVPVHSDCLGINSTAPMSGNYKVKYKNCTLMVGNSTIKVPVGSNKEFKKTINGVDISIKPPKLVFFVSPINIPFYGKKIGYLGYYILVSLIFGGILNLAFKKVRLRKKKPKSE